MKILHCADVHLDSSLNRNLAAADSRKRRAEILRTFLSMIEYAVSKEIKVILIAGDLFDTDRVSSNTAKQVQEAINNNPEIQFYYLNGNHDKDSFLNQLEEKPENLHAFGNEWTSYRYAEGDEEIVITGVELNTGNVETVYDRLLLNEDDYNIVMMHGQTVSSITKGDRDSIVLRQLTGKGIDYLALGHVHRLLYKELDKRGKYCYPGCLEGRGFDETGEHGFVMLDIDTKTHESQVSFKPFAQRRLYSIEVDVGECINSYEMEQKIKENLQAANIEESSLVRVVLTGAIDVTCEKNTDYLTQVFQNDYYYFVIKDKTGLKMDMGDYAADNSLKGEYVRSVMSDQMLSEEEKHAIIRIGLKAIMGEDLDNVD